MSLIISSEMLQGRLSAPTLGSTVHHVSVPGSIADTHRLNKIDTKNHSFIDNGENTFTKFIFTKLRPLALQTNIRVLTQRSYNVVVLFLQATWSANINLILKLILVS